MQLIGIGPSLKEPPHDLHGWKLSRALIAGLRSEAGYDLGAFGRLRFAFVAALVEPGTDHADAAPPTPRECPFGELSVGAPVFWDDNGVFTMEASDDPVFPGQVGAYSYAFRCSEVLKIALGAPDFGPDFPGHATDADVERCLTPPPHQPRECLAWLEARLPTGTPTPSLDGWLTVPGAPEWNEVLRSLARSLQAARPPGARFVHSTPSGQIIRSGLPEGALAAVRPGFSLGGQSWFHDGTHYRRQHGDLRLTAADFLRATLAVAALTWDFSNKNVRLSGAQAAQLTDQWAVDRLPHEVFIPALPF